MPERILVRVRAQRNVAGFKLGEEGLVEATPYVDALVASGMMIWLDAPRYDEPVGTSADAEPLALTPEPVDSSPFVVDESIELQVYPGPPLASEERAPANNGLWI